MERGPHTFPAKAFSIVFTKDIILRAQVKTSSPCILFKITLLPSHAGEPLHNAISPAIAFLKDGTTVNHFQN